MTDLLDAPISDRAFRLYHLIERYGNQQTHKELAKRLGCGVTMVKAAIDQLEAAGFLTKEEDHGKAGRQKASVYTLNPATPYDHRWSAERHPVTPVVDSDLYEDSNKTSYDHIGTTTTTVTTGSRSSDPPRFKRSDFSDMQPPQPQAAGVAVQADTKPNRFGGSCILCGNYVKAEAGCLADLVEGRWTVRHLADGCLPMSHVMVVEQLNRERDRGDQYRVEDSNRVLTSDELDMLACVPEDKKSLMEENIRHGGYQEESLWQLAYQWQGDQPQTPLTAFVVDVAPTPIQAGSELDSDTQRLVRCMEGTASFDGTATFADLMESEEQRQR